MPRGNRESELLCPFRRETVADSWIDHPLQLRVVLERTIASRPTPWGLLATFGALLQTQQAAIAAILAKLLDERGSAEFTAVIGDLAARASATPAAANNAGAANAPPPPALNA